MFKFVCIDVFECICMHMCAWGGCVCTCVQACMYVCVYGCVQLGVFVCECIWICVCVWACICICMCV